MYYAYILLSEKDNNFYIGFTEDITNVSTNTMPVRTQVDILCRLRNSTFKMSPKLKLNMSPAMGDVVNLEIGDSIKV